MAVHAVDACIELAADEPLEERWFARVEYLIPLLVPGQEVGVLDEGIREVLRTEAIEDRGIVAVRLLDEVIRWRVVVLLAPVDGNFRLRRGSVENVLR